MINNIKFLVFAILLTTCTVSSSVESAGSDLNHLATLLSQNFASVEDISLEYTHTENWIDGEKPKGSPQMPSKVKWFYRPGDGMQKFDILCYKDNSLEELVARRVYSWDGTRFFYWSQQIDEKSGKGVDSEGIPIHAGSASISGDPSLPPYGPLNFISHARTVLFTKKILDPRFEFKIVKSGDLIAGRKSLKVESKFAQLWFDTEQGFFLKSIFFAGKPGQPTDKIFETLEVAEELKVGNVWLPIKMKCTQFSPSGKGRYEGEIKILPDSIKVNTKLEASDFTVKFAPGTAVIDTLTKTEYNVPVPEFMGKEGPNLAPEQKLELILDKAERQKNAIP